MKLSQRTNNVADIIVEYNPYNPRIVRRRLKTEYIGMNRVDCTVLKLLFTILVLYTTVIASACDKSDARHRRSEHRSRSERYVSHEYGVVIDAGSSGSRVWVYKWMRSSRQKTLPEIEAVLPTHRVDTGLAEFADDLDRLTNVIAGLIDHAKQQVPRESHEQTPIYLFATAGMRFLTEDKANGVIDTLNALLQDKSLNPFYIDPQHGMRILSGEEEGVFAWLALNYLTGAFLNSQKSGKEKTFGILELGGASTQIAFIPSGNILANKFSLRLAKRRYPLYVHSYLFFGQDFVDLGIKEELAKFNTSSSSISNPCMLRGDESINQSRTYVGTGDPVSCLELLNRLVTKAERCYPKPCAIGAVYQPSLPLDKHFYAIGAFVRVLHTLHAIGPNGSIFLPDVMEKAKAYCQMSIGDAQSRVTDHRRFLSKNCLTGLYLNVLFKKGYGFAEDTRQIIAKENINGMSIDWTLGALLYERDYADWTDDSDCLSRSRAMSSYSLASQSTSLQFTLSTIIALCQSVVLFGV